MRFVAVCLFFAAICAGATEQSPERLIFEGKEVMCENYPLESFFEKQSHRPDWLTETNTACWRGYIGLWEIKDGFLFLTKLERDEWTDPAKDSEVMDITHRVFPDAKPPIRADWYSGSIHVPKGKILRTEGFTSIYERYVVLSFKNGVLSSTKTLNMHVKPLPHWKRKIP